MEEVPNFINIGPSNPVQTYMNVFEDFVCVLQMILLTKIKNLDVGSGAPLQWQETDAVPHSQPIAPQQTMCKFHLDPQYNIFHWLIRRYLHVDVISIVQLKETL